MSTQLALAEASGPLKELVNKLASDHGGEWLYALKRFLRKENPWVGVIEIGPVLLGTGLRNADEFYLALSLAGVQVDISAIQLFVRPEFRPEAELAEVSLSILGTAELAGKGGLIRVRHVSEGAALRGYDVCSAETLPQALLQQKDQLLESLNIGGSIRCYMVPILCYLRHYVFAVTRDASGLRLEAVPADGEDPIANSTRWVVCDSRSSSPGSDS